MNNKPFQIFWCESESLEDSSLFVDHVDTDDPFRIEQLYFKLIKKHMDKQGYVFISSTDHDLVPPAKFDTAPHRRAWYVDREHCDVRKFTYWSLPLEIPYKRWRAPTPSAVKGLKAAIITKRGTEISGEQIGRTLGRSSRGVRYWISEQDDSRSIDYSSWRLLLELAGFKNKPITRLSL